jgi:O-antigen/teichoic acid export membrane protein
MSLLRLIAKILFRSTSKYEKSLQPLSLRQNFSWTFISNVVYGGCQWAILVVLAKMGTPEMLGQLTLAIAIITPIFLLFNLNLRAVQATDAKQEYSFIDYLLLRFITTILALFVAIFWILIGNFQENTGFIILFIAISKAIESISDVIYGFLQHAERMDKVSKSIIIRNLISILSFTLTLYCFNSLKWASLSLAIVAGVTLIFYDIPTSSILKELNLTSEKDENNQITIKGIRLPEINFQQKKLLNLTFFSLPVGLIMMLLSFSTNIPRYFIEYYFGQRDLGIFSAMAYVPTAGYMLVLALGQSALSPLAKYYSIGNIKQFKGLILKLFLFGILLGLTGISITLFKGKEILTILYKSEYAQNNDSFILLMIWGGLLYAASLLGYGTAAARYFKSTLIMSSLIVIVTTITSFIWIPSYGLKGSALVLISNSIFQLLGTLILLFHAIWKMKKLDKQLSI